MTGAAYGKLTGQHEQPRQQAALIEADERRCEVCGTCYTTDECPECEESPEALREFLLDDAGDMAGQYERD